MLQVTSFKWVSVAGGDDLLPLVNLGSEPGAGASVPPGFAAWIRVYAVNPAAAQPTVDFFLRVMAVSDVISADSGLFLPKLSRVPPTYKIGCNRSTRPQSRP